MTDRAAELLLAACVESGVLAVFMLWRELEELAGRSAFTANEACAHAVRPGNWRLRDAIVGACGEVSPRKLGKLLAQWEGARVASLRIERIGEDAAGLLWKVSFVKPIPAHEDAKNGATMTASSR